MPPGRRSEIRPAPVTKSLGSRIRELRIQKALTQRDLAQRSGLLGSHISRIENGQRIPSLPTLYRLARALRVPFHSLIWEPGNTVRISVLPSQKSKSHPEAGNRVRNDAAFLRRLRQSASRLSAADRSLFLSVARKMARRK